jgi:hypothetical protein
MKFHYLALTPSSSESVVILLTNIYNSAGFEVVAGATRNRINFWLLLDSSAYCSTAGYSTIFFIMETIASDDTINWKVFGRKRQ